MQDMPGELYITIYSMLLKKYCQILGFDGEMA